MLDLVMKVSETGSVNKGKRHNSWVLNEEAQIEVLGTWTISSITDGTVTGDCKTISENTEISSRKDAYYSRTPWG